MEFDNILEKAGAGGWFQFSMFAMLSVLQLSAFESISINFIGGVQEHWCKVPDLANLTFEQQKDIAIPHEQQSDGSLVYSRCKMYPFNYTQYTIMDYLTWNRTAATAGLGENDYRDCRTGWVYDKSQFVSTITSQFDLVCDADWLVSLTSTIFMAGFLTGVATAGVLADRVGRKVTYVIYTLLRMLGGFLCTFSVHYVMFCVGRFIIAMGGTGAGTCVYVLYNEIMSKRLRAILGASLWQNIYSIGLCVTAWIGYMIRDHVKLQLNITLPMLLYVLLFLFVDESPRWLFSKRKYDRGFKILRKVAAINGKDVSMIDNIQNNYLNTDLTAKLTLDNPDTAPKGSVIDLYKLPNMRRKILILQFMWFSVSLVYYGLSFNVGQLVGDLYINVLLLGLVEFPANIACRFMIDKLGRRATNAAGLLLAGISMLLCIPFIGNKDLGGVTTGLAMVGKAGTTLTFTAIYMFTIELMPTVVRNTGLGACSVAARVSGMMAPFVGGPLANLWAPLPSLVFGVFGIASGLATFLLPETLGRELPETLEQAEQFRRDGNMKDCCSTVCKKDYTPSDQVSDDVTMVYYSSVSEVVPSTNYPSTSDFSGQTSNSTDTSSTTKRYLKSDNNENHYI